MQSLISISPINPVKDSKSIGAFQAKNHPGFFYSFLSSLSFGPIFGQASVMKEVCQNFGDKIQIVWGDKDDVVPLETKECELSDLDDLEIRLSREEADD